jgi:Rap1a immunity proteins
MYFTGNKLLEICQDDAAQCVRYIQGVTDGQLAAITATSRDVAYCIPHESTAVQVKDVVVRFLTDHPELRHRPAAMLVANALANAWPQCK